MTDPEEEDVDDHSDAFSALGDPLRIRIVETLATAHRQDPQGAVVPFAELRKACDVRDSGRFLYHLKKLRGHFVEKTEEGYRLTFAGREVAAAISAGRYTETGSLGPVDLEQTCRHCGSGVTARFEDGRVSVTCERDHPLFVWSVPPNAADEATVEELVDLAQLQVTQMVEMALLGNCAGCYGPVDTRIRSRTGEGGLRHVFRIQCGSCGTQLVGPAGYCLLSNHDVAAFYRRHDRSIRETYVWNLEFARDAAVTGAGGREDAAVRFDVELEGERLRAFVDDAGHVVETVVESTG